VEAELLEVRDQPRALVVLHDHLRARGERRLDPRPRAQAALGGVARQQAGAEHDRRVRRVGARRDGRDHDVAVVQLDVGPVLERDRDARRHAVGDLRAAGAGARLRRPLLARVRRRVGRREALLDRLVVAVLVGHEALERHPERALGLRERDAVLGAARAGERRHDLAEVELERLGVRRLLGVLVVPEALLARVRLDELDPLRVAARELEVAQRLGVDREDRAGRAELRRHVADRRAVGERQVRDAGPVELDELADHPVLAQHLGDGQHQVRGRRALVELAVQLEADDARDEHRHRLAEHGGLGLDAADAPAEHAQAVDHRRVRVGPDQRVGIGDTVVVEDHARQVLEVDLVDDAGVRRDDLEALERALPPAQERVALAIALELALGVDAERVARAEDVDLDGVVDDELRRDERVDLVRVAAQLRHRVAHGGEIDDGRDAGEVLHDHARRGERDLLRRLRGVVPAGERLVVLAVAQQVLEQDLQRERQPRDVVAGLEGVEAVDLVAAPADLECAASVDGVLRHALEATQRTSEGMRASPVISNTQKSSPITGTETL
jgi:hypothetical protein